MADFFFFTDLDLLNSQTNSQSFGPVLSSDPIYDANKDKFRLTSVHTATANPLAYAVCKGQVLVQSDATNSTLVNIILKPEHHPDHKLPAIKYYIYRGVLKSSLTDGANVVDGGNSLTKSILHNNSNSTQNILGIELIGGNYNNNDAIDNAFYLPKPGFELWTVYGGWSIGTFDQNGFGFEVVFERIGFNPDFNMARANLNVFELTKLTGTPSQADQFEYKTKKEVILNYIDAPAFYGNLASIGIFARNSTDSVDNNNIPSFIKRIGDSVYRDIIEGGSTSNPSNIFYNRNKVYLDIRNDFNFSFNYFENYDNNIKLSFIDDTNEPSTFVDYYASGWPLLTLDSLPTGNSVTPIRISMPVFDNPNPFVFVKCGTRRVSFIEKILHGKTKFQDLQVDTASTNYSINSIFIESPNYNGSTPISQYIRLKYFNKIENPLGTTGPLNLMKKSEPWDFIFDLKGIIKHSQIPVGNIKLFTFQEDVYIEDERDSAINYIGNIAYAQDTSDIILICYVSHYKTANRIKLPNNKLTITNSSYSSSIYDFFISKNRNISIGERELTLNTGSPQILKFKTKSGRKSLRDFDLNRVLFLLTISHGEWNNIVTTVNSFAPSSPVSFVVKNRNDLDNNPSNDSDLNDYAFTSADLYLRGLVDIGGSLSLNEVATNAKIYSFTD